VGKPVVGEALAPDVEPKIEDATGLDALYAPDAPPRHQPPVEEVNRPEEPVREKETSPLSSSSVPDKTPQSSEDKSKGKPDDSSPAGQNVDDARSNDRNQPHAGGDLAPDAPLVVRCEIKGKTTVSVFLSGATLPEGLSRMPDQIQLVVRLYDVVLSAPVRQMPPGDDQRVPHEFCSAPIDCRQGIGDLSKARITLLASNLQAHTAGETRLQIAYEVLGIASGLKRPMKVISGIIRSKDAILLSNPGHGDSSLVAKRNEAAVRLMHALSRVPGGSQQVTAAVYQLIIKACHRMKIDLMDEAEARNNRSLPGLESLLADPALESATSEFRKNLIEECEIIRLTTIKLASATDPAQDAAMQQILNSLGADLNLS